MGSAFLKSIFLITRKVLSAGYIKFIFSIKYGYSISFFTPFVVECCNRLFLSNQTCYCAAMVSMRSTSRYRSPCKVDPLCTGEVDSTELADVRTDWVQVS